MLKSLARPNGESIWTARSEVLSNGDLLAHVVAVRALQDLASGPMASPTVEQILKVYEHLSNTCTNMARVCRLGHAVCFDDTLYRQVWAATFGDAWGPDPPCGHPSWRAAMTETVQALDSCARERQSIFENGVAFANEVVAQLRYPPAAEQLKSHPLFLLAITQQHDLFELLAERHGLDASGKVLRSYDFKNDLCLKVDIRTHCASLYTDCTAFVILCEEKCVDYELLKSMLSCDNELLTLSSGSGEDAKTPISSAMGLNMHYTAYLLLCLGLPADEALWRAITEYDFPLMHHVQLIEQGDVLGVAEWIKSFQVPVQQE